MNYRGSLLLLTTFFLLTVALLIGSFWGALRINIRTAQVKENELRAHYAAKAGVADLIDELRSGHTWDTAGSLSPQWVNTGGSTFYKSHLAPTPLTTYDYPVTISVTLNGDPSVEKAEVISAAQITGDDLKTYSRTVRIFIVKTLSGDVVPVANLE